MEDIKKIKMELRIMKNTLSKLRTAKDESQSHHRLKRSTRSHLPLPLFCPGPLQWLLPLPGAHFPRHLFDLFHHLLRPVPQYPLLSEALPDYPLKPLFSFLLLNFLHCFIFSYRIFHHLVCSTLYLCIWVFFVTFLDYTIAFMKTEIFFPVFTAISLTPTTVPGT